MVEAEQLVCLSAKTNISVAAFAWENNTFLANSSKRCLSDTNEMVWVTNGLSTELGTGLLQAEFLAAQAKYASKTCSAYVGEVAETPLSAKNVENRLTSSLED
jgi:hypothetical protein